MRAKPGDHLVIQGHHVGEAEKEGEILEVRGDGGKPPFLVRWSDEERETLVFPGSDAVVHQSRRRKSKKTA
ncbi:MAG: DUF1918 domain-containing protein [Acidimicrobiia bacterium]